MFKGVSGYKIKMGLNKFSTSTSHLNKSNDSKKFNLDSVSKDFLQWFSGFTDAEGNFLISIDRNYVRFRFKISLHIDDIETLNIIKSKLNIGRVVTEKSRNSCSFVVQDFTEIKHVICALFNKFPLYTSKRLDLDDFYKAVVIKEANNSLSDVDKERIINLKNGMNSKRENYMYSITDSQIKINPNWFIGFLEGEGTFGIKTGSSLYLQVAQKNTSQVCLNAIVTFLTSLDSNLKQGSKILPLNVVSTVNAKTNVTPLVISSVDTLYYYILPILDGHTMYTYKYTSFKLWRAALILKIHGYYLLPEGKKLFLDISYILNKRYSTGPIQNVEDIILNIFKRYEDILLKNPPFDVSSNTPHLNNVRVFGMLNSSKNPKTVYIYENGSLINGSPFVSYSEVHKVLGLKSTSNTCNRYIDTDRLYKSKYLITSKPIDNIPKV